MSADGNFLSDRLINSTYTLLSEGKICFVILINAGLPELVICITHLDFMVNTELAVPVMSMNFLIAAIPAGLA